MGLVDKLKNLGEDTVSFGKAALNTRGVQAVASQFALPTPGNIYGATKQAIQHPTPGNIASAALTDLPIAAAVGAHVAFVRNANAVERDATTLGRLKTAGQEAGWIRRKTTPGPEGSQSDLFRFGPGKKANWNDRRLPAEIEIVRSPGDPRAYVSHLEGGTSPGYNVLHSSEVKAIGRSMKARGITGIDYTPLGEGSSVPRRAHRAAARVRMFDAALQKFGFQEDTGTFGKKRAQMSASEQVVHNANLKAERADMRERMQDTKLAHSNMNDADLEMEAGMGSSDPADWHAHTPGDQGLLNMAKNLGTREQKQRRVLRSMGIPAGKQVPVGNGYHDVEGSMIHPQSLRARVAGKYATDFKTSGAIDTLSQSSQQKVAKGTGKSLERLRGDDLETIMGRLKMKRLKTHPSRLPRN